MFDVMKQCPRTKTSSPITTIKKIVFILVSKSLFKALKKFKCP